MVKVIKIGSGLPHFLGASCSGCAFPAPVIFLLLALRSVKKLQIIIAFVRSLTAAGFRTDIVEFLTVNYHQSNVSYASLIPGSRHSWPLIPLMFCSLLNFVLLCIHLLGGLQFI
jgi:hypothetical protein